MATTATPIVELSHRYADALPELCVPWQGAEVPDPQLLLLNEPLAAELGLRADDLRSPEGLHLLVGVRVPEGAQPVAQVYAGHQFGGYSPRLGDGRALLLGEITAPDGTLHDLHLKGSGRTPFARGGDGKAAVGPMLREYVISEALHALGIPSTRSLAVVATGETVRREVPLPGAVLARTASSHIRVGTFQYAAATGSEDLLRRLADVAIERHHPAAAGATNPYLTLYEAVLQAQAELVARWLHVGFIHGVMNTDNTTISGETIDYGPCAFLDAYDPATVYSSIDHAGRYAFGNQPAIVQWNLARLAEALLPLIDPDEEAAVTVATERLQAFPTTFGAAWRRGMRAKLGLATEHDDDAGLFDDLLRAMHEAGADHTGTFRALAALVRGDDAPLRAALDGAADATAMEAWTSRYLERLATEGGDRTAIAEGMDRVNPRYIPRNHLVEEALAAATAGDLQPVEELVAVVRSPFADQPGRERYAQPAPAGFGENYQTFCGT